MIQFMYREILDAFANFFWSTDHLLSTAKKRIINLKLAWLPYIQSVHNDQQDDVMTKITSLEKRQFVHVIEGIR